MMKKNILIFIIVFTSILSWSQTADSSTNQYTNSVDNLLLNDNKLVLGGYGEVHYNQPLESSTFNNGTLDVHRIVLLFGYNFNKKTQFISELEFEHVKEVYVEQAFLQYKLNKFFTFRGGLMLVPMGIINEYHEPTAFNGVERPQVDKYIVPSTWREIGFGFTGNILPASIKYQVYLMNGFNGYDGSANVSGKNGLRKGRQKGAESFISSPNFSGRVEYFGIKGLNIGLSGYFGKTQSTLYDGIEKTDYNAVTIADSSVIGISILGIDTRYNFNGFQFRGQVYYTGLSNSMQYNQFTADTDGSLNDVGSSMIGYYAEVGYNVLRSVKTEKQLIPFVRYEFLNTHHSVESNITKNTSYEKTLITAGITLKLTQGAVVKTDLQVARNGATKKYTNIFNAGVGVMF